MSHKEKLHDALASHGSKMTSVRYAVFEALSSSSAPKTNSELIKSLPALDKVSVYRTLELFEQIGIVHRIWNGFKSKVELSDSFSPHHHHFTCQKCDTTISFKDQNIENALHALEDTLAVSIKSHVIELGGLCLQCSRESALTA